MKTYHLVQEAAMIVPVVTVSLRFSRYPAHAMQAGRTRASPRLSLTQTLTTHFDQTRCNSSRTAQGGAYAHHKRVRRYDIDRTVYPGDRPKRVLNANHRDFGQAST